MFKKQIYVRMIANETLYTYIPIYIFSMSLSIGNFGHFRRGLRLAEEHMCMWDEDSYPYVGGYPSGNWRLGLTLNTLMTEGNQPHQAPFISVNIGLIIYLT